MCSMWSRFWRVERPLERSVGLKVESSRWILLLERFTEPVEGTVKGMRGWLQRTDMFHSRRVMFDIYGIKCSLSWG